MKIAQFTPKDDTTYFAGAQFAILEQKLVTALLESFSWITMLIELSDLSCSLEIFLT